VLLNVAVLLLLIWPPVPQFFHEVPCVSASSQRQACSHAMMINILPQSASVVLSSLHKVPSLIHKESSTTFLNREKQWLVGISKSKLQVDLLSSTPGFQVQECSTEESKLAVEFERLGTVPDMVTVEVVAFGRWSVGILRKLWLGLLRMG